MFTVKDIIKVKIQERKSTITQGTRKCVSEVLQQLQISFNHQLFLKSRRIFSESVVMLTCSFYLNDSMPFFVDLTKRGCLSILVTWTSPPLLSMAPEWIAALQILDCWNHKSASVGKTMKPWGTRRNSHSRELCDSPHRRKEFPTLSLSYSCNWLDIYTCTDTEIKSMLKVKGASETFTDIRPVAGYPSTFVPQPSLTLDVLSWEETKKVLKKEKPHLQMIKMQLFVPK